MPAVKKAIRNTKTRSRKPSPSKIQSTSTAQKSNQVNGSQIQQNKDLTPPPAIETRPVRLLKNPKRHALTPEAKERQLAALRPNMIRPGEVRNPGGRPRRKPFHDAALLIADECVGATKSSRLMIKPNDTVAVAVAKSLAVTAMGIGPQKVSAAKELADRAEGSPMQTVLNNDAEGTKIQRGVQELLVRFGIQLSATVGDAEQ